MNRARTIQEWIHWLEAGAGARRVRLAAVLLGTLALSLLIAWKQFQGPASEGTLRQADVGRQLARGEGFTTLVNYPQVHAYLAPSGRGFNEQHPLPELYEAPLYPLLIAAGLRGLPTSYREHLFAQAPQPPDGFGADYFLLGLNLLLFWLAAWQTYDLGRRLFEPRVGWVAAFGLLLAVPIWQQVVAVNGLPLLMVLSLAVFRCWWQVELAFESRKASPWGWLAGLGAGCGLLFLAEYTAGALLLVVLGYVAWRVIPARRWAMLGLVLALFAVVTGPWIARNLSLTGYPTGLAWQNVALKEGDPTASPETVRTTLSAELPRVDFNKLGNKVLTSWQDNLESRLWSGGAMWFMALFAVGWLYAFRTATTDRLRWMFALALLVMLLVQAAANSGESERLVAAYLSPLIMIFGAGFFFVLIGSNSVLSRWPGVSAVLLLVIQALPLLHDALEPRRLHFHYPPYYPRLFMGMREELAQRDSTNRFGVMADVPAGVAWYSGQRVWAQPARLKDFYAITIEQSIGELLLTPHTLDRPFFSELAATRDDDLRTDIAGLRRFGEWGRIYAGLMTGRLPAEFPLRVPQRLAENLYVFINPALPPPR
ncbi:MAG: glycosyltransferase family 39 protein [Cephaloticoccus sp.]|nr:glycosyltransferase family 39 protein [Cephaloticoccus sp.]MCF7761932.1 glycosyltransferase family 39 protein [Cephaloticoccus sp.]